jgi:aspartyl protease family protein
MDFSSFNKSDWSSFAVLMLLLVMMISNLLSRQDLSISQIFKYLGAWSIIGLVTIALYSYRFEFSDFKNRILGEINPSLVILESSGSLRINISSDGHFYIDVRINDIPMHFMIDTGASDIVISVSEAEKIGINPKNLIFNKPYQTANGRSWGASIKFDKVEVGDVIFRDVSASVNNANMGTSLLGMSFLRKFKKYEFYRDKLILTI